MNPPGLDIWRVGLAEAPITTISQPGGLGAARIHWLPEAPPQAFFADPFGLWRDGRLHLFVEAYDYRSRKGVIQWMTLDQAFQSSAPRTVLKEPWHLSYPQVFTHDDQVWMLPEAHRSGGLTLYRAVNFPEVWEPAARFELDTAAIDATPFRHEGLWWLAYSPDGPQSWKQGRLHLAYAERLTGPWRPHPMNPVRIDRASSRPGGTVFERDGRPVLPVQDCSRTYGGAVRLLEIQTLTPDRFKAEAGPPLEAPASAGGYKDGLHTLSACGPVTLFDVKRIDRSLRSLTIAALSRAT